MKMKCEYVYHIKKNLYFLYIAYSDIKASAQQIYLHKDYKEFCVPLTTNLYWRYRSIYINLLQKIDTVCFREIEVRGGPPF